jgi:ribosome-associated translation inhibitor RaiA
MMQINVHTDNSIDQHEPLARHVENVINDALNRFADQITRVEVHLSDAKAEKGADGDNRCLIEAKLVHFQPIAVSDHGPNLHQAIAGAAEKLKRSVDSTIGKLHDTKVRPPRGSEHAS